MSLETIQALEEIAYRIHVIYASTASARMSHLARGPWRHRSDHLLILISVSRVKSEERLQTTIVAAIHWYDAILRCREAHENTCIPTGKLVRVVSAKRFLGRCTRRGRRRSRSRVHRLCNGEWDCGYVAGRHNRFCNPPSQSLSNPHG